MGRKNSNDGRWKKWGTHDLVTKKKYTSYEGHVEFIMMVPAVTENLMVIQIAASICRTAMKFRLNHRRGKTLQILTSGRSDPMGLPLSVWTVCLTVMPGDRMVSGMLSFHFQGCKVGG